MKVTGFSDRESDGLSVYHLLKILAAIFKVEGLVSEVLH